MKPAGADRHGPEARTLSSPARANQTFCNSQRRLLAQFHVPLRKTDKVFPEVVLLEKMMWTQTIRIT